MKPMRNSALAFLGVLSLLIGVFAPISVVGAAQTQALQAVASYANPLTGKIEDSGQNSGIGQGMVESLILKTPSTLLTDDAGGLFITFRVGLVQESKDLAIELLDASGKVKEALPYSVVAEQNDENTRDIRVKVPASDSVLRISLVSIPMGREVVGFASFAPEGEVVAAPVTGDPEKVDDSALSVYENTKNDEVKGVSAQARTKILVFLGITVGLLLVVGGVVGVVYLRKRKTKGDY